MHSQHPDSIPAGSAGLIPVEPPFIGAKSKSTVARDSDAFFVTIPPQPELTVGRRAVYQLWGVGADGATFSHNEGQNATTESTKYGITFVLPDEIAEQAKTGREVAFQYWIKTGETYEYWSGHHTLQFI